MTFPRGYVGFHDQPPSPTTTARDGLTGLRGARQPPQQGSRGLDSSGAAFWISGSAFSTRLLGASCTVSRILPASLNSDLSGTSLGSCGSADTGQARCWMLCTCRQRAERQILLGVVHILLHPCPS